MDMGGLHFGGLILGFFLGGGNVLGEIEAVLGWF